jgi:transposase
MSEPEEVVVGIDVAKASLDLAVRPSGEDRHVAPDAEGIAAAVAWLQALGRQVMVVEATGGSEAPLVAELGVASLAVAVVNPRQVRAFARATGRLAKTDRLDAHVLAHFAAAVRPTPRPLPEEAAQELKSPAAASASGCGAAYRASEPPRRDTGGARAVAHPGTPRLARGRSEGGGR